MTAIQRRPSLPLELRLGDLVGTRTESRHVDNCPVCASFLGGEGEQVAFQRCACAGKRRDLTAHSPDEVRHDAVVTAAVSAGRRVERYLFYVIRAVVVDGDLRVMTEAGAQRGACAVIAHRAVFFVGVTMHDENDRSAVLQFHADRLVIDYVIVAAIDATAIGAGL